MPPCAGMIQIRFDGRSLMSFLSARHTGLPCSGTECTRGYAGAMSAPAATATKPSSAPLATASIPNLPLCQRPIDIFFAVMFTIFIVTSYIADMLPTVGIDFTQPNGTFLVDSNYWYAQDADPLFMNPPVWMRIVTGLSAFVYLAFYLVLVPALIRGWNWIQLPSVIYATMIASI